MHESFLHATRPRSRHICLRVTLKPLTLGHKWLLYEISSPLALNKSAGFRDILLAVLICAQGHRQARKDLRRKLWLSALAIYWGFRCRKLTLKEEIEKFKAYWADEQRMPPLRSVPKGESREICAPWDWVLLEHLMFAYGMTLTSAMDLTYREANLLWALRADAENRASLAGAGPTAESIIKGIWKRRREAAALSEQTQQN